MSEIDKIKQVVLTFNKEVIENGNPDVSKKIFADGFVNHSAVPGMPSGAEGMLNTFNNILRPAIKNLRVEIRDQIAEGDKVTTRKTITGIHSGTLMGIEATGRKIEIEVIDIVRIQNGQYAEHWGMNNLVSVLAQLKA